MKIRMLLIAVVLTGLLFCLSASAQISCSDPQTTDPDCITVPIDVTGKTFIESIPKFDTSLGELTSVELTTEACGTTSLTLDSEDPQAQTWFITTRGGIILTLPTGKELFVSFGTPQGTEDVINTAADNDGTPDFIGTDSGSVEYPNVCDDQMFVFDTQADMALFKGSAGDTLPVTVATNSSSTVRNPFSTNYAASSFARAGGSVCVVYTYQPPCPRFCINGTKTDACTTEGIPLWEICLSNSSGPIACTLTNADGEYSFCDLVPGDYQVSEETRANWKPVGPTSVPVTLEEVSAEGVDFVNEPPFCISGFKFNGTTTEGLPGWTIRLTDAAGAVKTTTTGADGSYEFCGLFSGTYTVCEVTQPNWTPIGPTCITVNLDCEDSENNNFRNTPVTKPPCGPGCPWFIKNELYTAKCTEIKEVGADKGILANEMFKNAVVLNPEDITIDPKYGTLTVEEDGSFVYDPTTATALRTGTYVIFKYGANNGLCDAKYLGIAKIQVSCK